MEVYLVDQNPSGRIEDPLNILQEPPVQSASFSVLYRGRGEFQHNIIHTSQEYDFLKIFAQNVQGLTREKFYDLQSKLFSIQYDIISLSETWLKSCDPTEFVIQGYHKINKHRFRIHRNAKRGSGGILLYIYKRHIMGKC